MNNDNKLILEPDNDISTSDQTNRCEEITLLKDDIELGHKPININEDPCIKNLNILYKIVLFIFITVSILSLGKLIEDYTIIFNVNITEIQSDKCANYLYGCCEIYDTCSVSSDEFSYTHLTIDPRVVHKHDSIGINCPRVIDMINDYMEKYGEISCSSSRYGCCELNFICDMREYYQQFYNESNYYTIRAYQSNINHNYISKSMGISKVDEIGSNCPKHYNLIMEYEQGNLI